MGTDLITRTQGAGRTWVRGGELGIDVLICSDDIEAAKQVTLLTEAIGMGGYYAGNLDNAIVVEGLTALLISMNKYYKGNGSIRIEGIEK